MSAADAIPRRTSHALDLLNFFLADVRDGLGPYLSIYLLLTHHWDQASIGLVMGIGGLAAIAAQTPVGAAVDRTTAKRALIVAGALTVGRQLGLRAGSCRDHAGSRRPAILPPADRTQRVVQSRR